MSEESRPLASQKYTVMSAALADDGFRQRLTTGSWLSEEQPYVVEANGGKTAYFRNPATAAGTYDDAWAIEESEFTIQGN